MQQMAENWQLFMGMWKWEVSLFLLSFYWDGTSSDVGIKKKTDLKGVEAQFFVPMWVWMYLVALIKYSILANSSGMKDKHVCHSPELIMDSVILQPFTVGSISFLSHYFLLCQM